MAAKFVSMFVSIVSVPLLLSVLGTQQYGFWVTLTSLVAFVSLLDLGMGNSLRNSIASIDILNIEKVHAEFIGFFRLLFCVGLIAAIIFMFFIPYFNIPNEIAFAAIILYLPLIFLLPFMIGASVLQGSRATGLQAVLQVLGNVAFITFISLLAWIKYKPSLNTIAFVWSFFYSVVIIIVFFIALNKLHLPISRLFYNSISRLHKGRLLIGIEFLVLQVASLMLYSLGNLLLFTNLGADEVARYDVINKIYQVCLSLYTVIIGVMWPEISRARAKKDVNSLDRIFRNLAATAGLFSIAAIFLAFAAPTLVKFWTSSKILIEIPEALAIAGLVTCQALAYVGAVFMNAFEQIRIQIYLGIASILLMIPLVNYFIKINFGITSVPVAAMILTFISMIICNVYASRLIHDIRNEKAYT